MAEFELIQRYCYGIGADHPDTIVGVGDDAAIVRIPSGFELAISVDTMVAGVHFFDDVGPARLAHKLMAVNLSDMAAMGAQPKWATIALTQPGLNEVWLSEFMHSTDVYAKQHGVQLIGGDSTQGSLTLTLQIMGLLPEGEAMTRTGAACGDDIYVSGELGDAALALSLIKSASAQVPQTLIDKLEKPEPQVVLGQALLKHASSCIDVSDGLLADLQHIAQASCVALQVDAEKLPFSDEYAGYFSQTGDYNLALTGGDDYQLAFTAAQLYRDDLAALSNRMGTKLTRIGSVVKSELASVQASIKGQPLMLGGNHGYQHFTDSK